MVTKKRPARLVVSREMVLRLCLETACDDGTVRKWARGDTVRGATDSRLTKACSKLGYQLAPPTPSPA